MKMVAQSNLKHHIKYTDMDSVQYECGVVI